MTHSRDETQQATTEVNSPSEIRHIPLWVKGSVAACILLSLIQLLEFKNSLNDAVQKKKAATAYNSGNYIRAIDLYKDLISRYPKDKGLLKALGFAQYRETRYYDSINTFKSLDGEKMLNKEVEEINGAISDMVSKLNLKSKEAE